MAGAQQSAAEYLRNHRCELVIHMQNFNLIVDNLYQRKVFNDHDVDALNAEKTGCDKARCILDWVIKRGEMASYELLKILDSTQKRTLHSDSHRWISCFSFKEDADVVYSFGTKPCQNYQTHLKMKAKRFLGNQETKWQLSSQYLKNKTTTFSYVPLVLQTDSVVKTADYKIQMKRIKCKKPRAKKLKLYIPDDPETLSPEDLLKGNKNILLIGKPGIGKTTAVQQILKVWTEKDNKDHDYMFYFDESDISHSLSVRNLQSFLFDFNIKPKENEIKEVFQDIEENSENVVLIFDGVSCVPDQSILRKIIDQDVLPDAKVIITCRSEVEDDPLFSDWPKVYVQGFSEESIRTYHKKMLSHKPDLLDVVLNNQELFSLSYVPMYAFMIAAFITFNSNTAVIHPHTVTEMYIHIFRDALKEHGRKKIGQIDQYLSENKDQLYHLMKNAFRATEQKSLNLHEISCDETNICHAFLKTITIRESLTSVVTYCAFLHNTMQEFFSALWLLGNPDEIEKVLNLCQTEENKHMRHLLPFLCGLLGEHNSKLLKCLFLEDQMKKTSEWFIEKLMDTFLQSQSDDEDIDLLFVCQCLYELQSPKACLMFLEKMNYQWDFDMNLDPHQSCALSYVISQSRDKEVYLDMEDCTVFDTGMNMILSCSPQIRLKPWKSAVKQIKFLLGFFPKATSMEVDESTENTEMTDALLDLYSHVKDYESQTGRSFFPALQLVFQLAPDVWIIDLSKRKISILLEVLKLQTEKKPVELRRCSDDESEMMSFLHCLPHISQLRFYIFETIEATRFWFGLSETRFVFKLFVKAAETDRQTGSQMLERLTSVFTYSSFPFEYFENISQSDFLLELCSHVKDYESKTGCSLLPALKPVYLAAPDVWIIDLSKRKSSILLEVLKLQTEKKPVELIDWTEEKKPVKLRGCSDDESEIMSLLNCLQYISQLRMSSTFMLSLIREIYESRSSEFVFNLLSSVKNCINLRNTMLESVDCAALRFILQNCTAVTLDMLGTFIPDEEMKSILSLFSHVSRLSVDRQLLLRMFRCCSTSDVHQETSALLLSALQHKLDFSRNSALYLNKDFLFPEPLQLTAEDCHVVSTVIQRAYSYTQTLIHLNLHNCQINTAGVDELFTVLHFVKLSVDRQLLLRMFHCCRTADVHQRTSALLLSALQHKLDFSCNSAALDLTEDFLFPETLQLTAEDCHVVSAVIQRACSDTQTLTHLNLHDCQINTAGVDELFTVLHSLKLSCDKSMLLQFLSHVGHEKADALSQALDEKVDLSQTQLDKQVFRGLGLVLEHSQGLTELDLSQCRLTDQSLNLFLKHLHKAQNIDLSGNNITDDGARKIYNIVSLNRSIKSVRLFNNRIQNTGLFHGDPRFQIW